MKIDYLREAGFILDITVDLTQLDEDVKREYLKRKNTEQDYIDKHLEVTILKYDKITNITFVLAKLDEDIIKKYKAIGEHPMKKIVKQLAKTCDEIRCDDCPYYREGACLLKRTNSFPNMWSHLTLD